MSNQYRSNLTPEPEDYTLDSILENYYRDVVPDEKDTAQRSPKKTADALEYALNDALRQHRQNPVPHVAETLPQNRTYSAQKPIISESANNAEDPRIPEENTKNNSISQTVSKRPQRQEQRVQDDVDTVDIDLPWGTRPAQRPAHTTRHATLEDYVRMEAEVSGVFKAYQDPPDEVPSADNQNTAPSQIKPQSRPPQQSEGQRQPAQKSADKEQSPPKKTPQISKQSFGEESDDDHPENRPEPQKEKTPKRSFLQFLKDSSASEDMDDTNEPDDYQEPEQIHKLYEVQETDEDQEADVPSFLERILRPIVRKIATNAAQRELREAEAAKWPDPVDVPEGPELAPRKAGKFYATQLRPLRFRFRTSLFLCFLLVWITLQAPMVGALGKSVSLQAGVCLVLTLSVMIAALDIVAVGIQQLLNLQLGMESLAVLGTVFSCIDAVVIMLGYGDSLPFCAVGALSLFTALWGQRRFCLGQVQTLRVASYSKATCVIVSETNDQSHLIRTQRGPEGIVRLSEKPDLSEKTYATAAPLLLIACLILSIIASLSDGSRFLHILSALLSASASFTAFLSFSLPYSITARRLGTSGAAIAGYAGCANIGKTKDLVITDEDLFPSGTINLKLINIQEGTFVPKVISSTYSLLEASGNGLTGIFQELLVRRGYSRLPIEEFQCHEGGGLSGLILGERVLVGSAGFMNLMGIRLPQNMTTKNTICTAFGQELVAVFVLEYIPTSSVQDALVTLLHGKTYPVFAIRDFNITPLMIRQLFRMPTDNFNFPSFRDRYRITEPQEQEDISIAAIVTRSGMGPMVEAVEAGRRLFNASRIGTILSLVGSITGILILFLLFRAGSYDTATAGNVLTYMLLWAMPVIMLAFGQSR